MFVDKMLNLFQKKEMSNKTLYARRVFNFTNPGHFYNPVYLFKLEKPYKFIDMTLYVRCETNYIIVCAGVLDKIKTMAFLASNEHEEALSGLFFGDCIVKDEKLVDRYIKRYDFLNAEIPESEVNGICYKECLKKIDITVEK